MPRKVKYGVDHDDDQEYDEYDYDDDDAYDYEYDDYDPLVEQKQNDG